MLAKPVISLVLIFEISLKNELTRTFDLSKKSTKVRLPFAKINSNLPYSAVILRIVVAVSRIPLPKVDSQH